MKKGKLKILAGSGALHWLISQAKATYSVDVDDTTLTWCHSDTSPKGILQGNQIESVKRHGKDFVVHLHKNTNGIPALTFRAPSRKEAKTWVTEIERIVQPPAVLLAAPVSPDAKVSEDPTPVKISYKIADGELVEKDCALLVLACDPRNLEGVMQYTNKEQAIFGKLINFTFHTTLMKVKVPANPGSHGVIFAPQPLEQMNGSFYGFRNESAKQFGVKKAKKMEHNLVTTYQLVGPTSSPWDTGQFLALLEKQLAANNDWWPYGANYEILTSVTTPYFDHFCLSDLKDHLPWDILNLQGKNNTLFVHAFTCFESVVHCWGYTNLMLESFPAAQHALPRHVDAPIIILGAGASGLLFATKLNRLGYKNVQLLETTDRFGGKTHTIIQDGPYPDGSTESTICELGTCYLSPAYEPMVDDLQKYLVGNKQIDFAAKNKSFRGIVSKGEFPLITKLKTVMDYGEYVIRKAEEQLKLGHGCISKIIAIFKIALDLGKYSLIHAEYVGWSAPMPQTPPEALKHKFGKQTFHDFLEYHGLLSLVGILEYGYEVQGYGRISNIPAYYGLVWVTPAITWAILLDKFKPKREPIVSAWTKGWADLWEQVVEKQQINITYNVTTTSIIRNQM